MEIPGRRSLTERMKGAALLQRDVYAEVEADTSATAQAAIVVGLVAIAAAIGAGFAIGPRSLVGALVSAYVGWLVWSGVTYLIGDKLLGGTATWGELLRALGFAQTPSLLLAFAFIPVLGWLIAVVVGIWVLIAAILALSEALDFGIGRAVLTAVLGWVALLVVRVLGWMVGLV